MIQHPIYIHYPKRLKLKKAIEKLANQGIGSEWKLLNLY